EKRIISLPEAMTTADEVDMFLQQAGKHRWNNLADLAFSKHLWNIPDLFKNMKGDIRFESVENCLDKHGDPESRNLVLNLEISHLEANYAIYQTAIWLHRK